MKNNDRQTMVLIDGNSLLNRAFYATPLFTTKDGLPTNGVFGFLKLLMRILSDLHPRYLVVAFDMHAPTFRHAMYGEYKAGRKPMPEDLCVQVPVLKECLSEMGVTMCEKEGYEADDLIGTLSRKFPVHSVIYTGDRDAYQLVDENTDVYFTKRGVTDVLRLTAENFKDIVGLSPSQIIDLKALMGDKSDHIPGVAGIGEKTAQALLQSYGTLEGVYEHASRLGGAVQRKLEEGREQAFFSQKLATIDVNAPVDLELGDCVCLERFPLSVKEKFAELEFKSLYAMDIFEEKPSIGANAPSDGGDAVPLVSYRDGDDMSAFFKALEGGVIAADFAKHLHVYAGGTEYVFPVKESLFDEGFFEEQLVPILQATFSDADRTVVLYRGKDFRHRLRDLSVTFQGKAEDVSLMKYLIDYTGKDDEPEYLLSYYHQPADKAAYGLYQIYRLYEKRLQEEDMVKLYREIELPLVDVLYSMENEGVCVAEEMLAGFNTKYDAELNELSESIYALAGEKFNLNSPAQLGVILFEKFKLGDVKKGKNGRYSTSADVLEKLAPDSELVRKILRYRTVQKLKSTYIDGIRPFIEEGKIHTTYNQVVTTTGRLSSMNPNMQNIPVRNEEGKEMRKLFVASEGNVLLDADYSQIELRLLAHFSGCKELITAYNKGEDIHALTASQVFNVPLSRVTGEMRRSAKAVNFGIIYGISAFGLARDLNIGVAQAQAYIDKYFARYSAVKEYMEENVERAKLNGYVTTLTGRKRVINELKSSNYNVRSFGERAAMNMPLQGSSADIIKIAMIRVHRRLKESGLKAKLILQVHDELVLDCPEEEQEEAARILKEEMENAVTLRVPLTVEVGSGKSWFEAK